MKINIVDSIMGSGKTQAAINYMNNSNDDEKFLYVTPYLTEVDRIIKSCPSKNFRQPEKYGTKIRGIKDLLNKGYNIVTTHTLFHLFDDEIIDDEIRKTTLVGLKLIEDPEISPIKGKASYTFSIGGFMDALSAFTGTASFEIKVIDSEQKEASATCTIKVEQEVL